MEPSTHADPGNLPAPAAPDAPAPVGRRPVRPDHHKITRLTLLLLPVAVAAGIGIGYAATDEPATTGSGQTLCLANPAADFECTR